MGCTLLTGWSLSSDFHSKISYDNVVDSTFLSEKLISDHKLIPDWENLLIEEITKETPPESITGFSLGAILSLRYAQLCEVKQITLIAPAFSFSKRQNTPHGIPSKQLDQMISNIPERSALTMKTFYRNCGVKKKPEFQYPPELLITGLELLKEINLPRIPLKGNPKIEILHGSDDRIISIESGRDVADFYSTSLSVIKGGHVSPLYT